MYTEKNRPVIIMMKKMCNKMSFPTIGKSIFPAFHAFMYIAHIFINNCYLFDCIFFLFSYFELFLCIRCTFERMIFLFQVFNTIESGRSMICPKTSIYIYTGESTVLGRTRKIYRRTLHIVQFI